MRCKFNATAEKFGQDSVHTSFYGFPLPLSDKWWILLKVACRLSPFCRRHDRLFALEMCLKFRPRLFGKCIRTTAKRGPHTQSVRLIRCRVRGTGFLNYSREEDNDLLHVVICWMRFSLNLITSWICSTEDAPISLRQQHPSSPLGPFVYLKLIAIW